MCFFEYFWIPTFFKRFPWQQRKTIWWPKFFVLVSCLECLICHLYEVSSNSFCYFIRRCTPLMSHVDVVASEPTTRCFPLNRWPIGSRDSEIFGCRKYTTIADSSQEMTEYVILLFRVVNIRTSLFSLVATPFNDHTMK